MKAFVAALLCLAYASALPTNSMWVVSNPPAEDSGVKASFEKKTIPYPSDPLKEDEVLFHLDYATVDASNRLWISANFKENAKKQGMEFFLGFARDNDSPMLTYAAVLSVIESNNPDYTPGQLYIGSTVLAEYVVLNPKDVPSGLTRHDPTPGVPESFALGPFGLTSGITAWTAVMSMKTRAKQMGTADLQKGDKVYVSAGSGAVGMMATQIYKSLGADVIASTGSDAKVKFLQDEIGITAFNYKTKDIRTELAAFAPDGLQYYFDNVGGATLEAAIDSMGMYGNVILCGMISGYGKTDAHPIRNLFVAVGRQLTLRGFIVAQFAHMFGDAVADIGAKFKAGQIKWKEDRFAWDEFPAALEALLTGSKFGKTILVGTQKPSHAEL